MSESTDLYMRGHSARMAMIEMDTCPIANAAEAPVFVDVVEAELHQSNCDWCRGWAAAERELFNGVKP